MKTQTKLWKHKDIMKLNVNICSKQSWIVEWHTQLLWIVEWHTQNCCELLSGTKNCCELLSDTYNCCKLLGDIQNCYALLSDTYTQLLWIVEWHTQIHTIKLLWLLNDTQNIIVNVWIEFDLCKGTVPIFWSLE